jgi:hypothetical protein
VVIPCILPAFSCFFSWKISSYRLWEGKADESERYEEIFQLKKHEKAGRIQGITTRF